MKCKTCRDDFEPSQMTGDVCRWCADKKRFADFAKKCKLKRFPDPTGERYVYNVNGTLAGKKVEETDFIDELWNALARSCAREDLVV